MNTHRLTVNSVHTLIFEYFNMYLFFNREITAINIQASEFAMAYPWNIFKGKHHSVTDFSY